MKRILFIFLILSAVLVGYFFWRDTTTPIQINKADFSTLPGWQNAQLSSSFTAFKHSCDVFVKQSKNKNVGTKDFPLKVKHWLPSCLASKKLVMPSQKQLKAFFEHWFEPVFYSQNKPMEGTFTGYYLPVLKGNWQQSKKYPYPIYAEPKDLLSIDLSLFNPDIAKKKIFGRLKGHKMVPYYNRENINKGAIDKSATPLLWVSSQVDRFFLEIQGSGYVDMTDGSHIMLGYAAQNGKPYTSIGRYLLQKGVFDKAHASMQSIRQYLAAHPEEINEVLNKNESFIFFKMLDKGLALGAQGAALTPGYSLAVDRKYIPLGVPMWLTTSYPKLDEKSPHDFNRLMIAQDTGGAIKGRVRGDVFWGDLKEAAYIAGHMNNPGQYWMLLPKH